VLCVLIFFAINFLQTRGYWQKYVQPTLDRVHILWLPIWRKIHPIFGPLYDPISSYISKFVGYLTDKLTAPIVIPKVETTT